jgi:hypothetical protein
MNNCSVEETFDVTYGNIFYNNIIKMFFRLSCNTEYQNLKNLTCSSLTTSSTNPASFACSAVGLQPSSPSILSAFTSPMMRAKWTEEQPSETILRAPNGVENVALSEARMASQSVADVTTAPMAGPLTAAMMGLGKSMNVSKTAAFSLIIVAWRVAGIMGPRMPARLTPAREERFDKFKKVKKFQKFQKSSNPTAKSMGQSVKPLRP